MTMTREQRHTLIGIAASALCLLAAVITTHFVTLPRWAAAACYLPTCLIAGWEVFSEAAENVCHGEIFDENFLMTIAAIAAFAIGRYAEAASVLLLYRVGELFESLASARSRSAIASLMELTPETANREAAEGQYEVVESADVAVGEIIVVRPGERIPLDGVVRSGTSMLDTSALTGESVPRTVRPGDAVSAGCINTGGLLRVEVSRRVEDSAVSRVLELVESAADRKAQTERFITRFARYYTPTVVGAALLLAVLPPLVWGNWQEWIYRACSFLVVSCPCALVISVPMGFFGGVGAASKMGVLIKGGSYLEALAETDSVVFDKTGTLTEGVFEVTELRSVRMPEAELLDWAAAVERMSDHPIALSIAAAAEARTHTVTEVHNHSGRGLTATVDGHAAAVGSDALMEALGVAYQPCETAATVAYLALDGQYEGAILISDRVKSGVPSAITALRRVGVRRMVMLTGDRAPVGESVASQLGLDAVRAELLPADKLAALEELLTSQKPGRTLVYVGDGVNDAPVLTRADVGIAMGKLGSDTAIEAADVVLMDDDPGKLARAVRLAQKTMRIVRQNIVFALSVKALILLLGLLGVTNLWLAVFADVGVSVLAICNAMRALWIRV